MAQHLPNKFYEPPMVVDSMLLPPAQRWPQHYPDPPPPPPPPTHSTAFTNYPSPAAQVGPSTSLLYTPPWYRSSAGVQLVADTHISVTYGQGYHPLSSQEAPIRPGYRTSSECTIICTPERQAQHPNPPIYGYIPDRARSPSSHPPISHCTGGETSGRQLRQWEDGASSEFGDDSPRAADVAERHSLIFRLADEADVNDGVEGSYTDSRQTSVPVSSSTTNSPSSQHHVKMEPDESGGCFIMELSSYSTGPAGRPSSPTSKDSIQYNDILPSDSLAPPTEVPLRATQASKEMRRMMGVFRLNPFAMHSLSLGGMGEGDCGKGKDGVRYPTTPIAGAASWCGGEPRALEEEPVMFEFQLDIIDVESESEQEQEEIIRGVPVLAAKEESQLRPFSPSFELHEDEAESNVRSKDEKTPGTLHEPPDQACHEEEQDNEQHSEWEGQDCSGPSDIDGSSTTTRSVHTPFTDNTSPQPLHSPVQLRGGSEYDRLHTYVHTPPPLPASAWESVSEQYHANLMDTDPTSGATSLGGLNFSYVVPNRGQKLHTTTSHPYLRRGILNHQAEPTSVQAQPRTYQQQHHVHPQTGISLLNMPTHHSQRHHILEEHYEQDHPMAYHSGYPHVQQAFEQHRGQKTHQHSIPEHDHHLMAPRVSVNHATSLGLSEPSYMRSNQGYHGQVRELHDTPRSSSSPSIHAEVYPVTISVAPIVHHSARIHHPQPGGSGFSINNRRWSLPETGASGPFLSM